MHAATSRDPACPGCLGNGRCWVCLGTGQLRHPAGRLLRCHACLGTGRCAKCQDLVDRVQVVRQFEHPGPLPVAR